MVLRLAKTDTNKLARISYDDLVRTKNKNRKKVIIENVYLDLDGAVVNSEIKDNYNWAIIPVIHRGKSIEDSSYILFKTDNKGVLQTIQKFLKNRKKSIETFNKTEFDSSEVLNNFIDYQNIKGEFNTLLNQNDHDFTCLLNNMNLTNSEETLVRASNKKLSPDYIVVSDRKPNVFEIIIYLCLGILFIVFGLKSTQKHNAQPYT